MGIKKTLAAVAIVCVGLVSAARGEAPRPNIVLILADDLGVGELGCYGQEKIKTPNIDALAKDGVRFRSAYSPSPVCAPTRCALLSGKHLGHSYVRDNREVQPEGQEPIPDEVVTIAEVLKGAGYATACVGKWGLGPVGSSGDPNRQGFDFFYGHNCQRVAHNQYAGHVWRNAERVELPGNDPETGKETHYTPDLMAEEAVKWLKGRKDEPFFLYFATPLPHLGLQAPAEAVAQYKGTLGEEVPFVRKGNSGYVSNETPHATYAAMVTKIDEYVGRIVATLKEMGVEENTLIVFASDNGPTFNIGGADSAFFGSAQGRKGLKQEVYEGGIRVPLIVRWPGRAKRGAESGYVTALYDLFPTFAEVAGAEVKGETDGISLVPVVEGKEAKAHEYLYWEYHAHGGRRALRKGDLKVVQNEVKRTPAGAVELYDLAADPGETRDLAKERPAVAREMFELMKRARTESPVKAWNFPETEPVR